MKALYPALAMATLALASCVDDESYNDWAAAPQNPDTTEAERVATSFSVASVAAIDFATIDEETDTLIAVFTPSLTTTGATADTTRYAIIFGNSTDETPATKAGVVKTAQLRAAIEAEYGRTPVSRDLPSTVVVYQTFGTLVSRATAEVVITATLSADFVEWIFVPGNAQGWTPATAPALHSPDFDGKYTGYALMNGDFKFTKQRDWGDEYGKGDFVDFGEGFEASTDGSNIKCSADAGLYWMTVDLTTGKLSGTPITTMGLIGDATPGAWATDTPMTWNAESNTYTWTGDLAKGEVKFRANGGWDVNLGGSTDELTQGGDNIALSEAGNYTVTLYPLITTEGGKMHCTLTKN